jgi:hypothetical protein
MGRVKVPRCDNCGAPVEFAAGAAEARCQYCSEVLIRELHPPPAPAPAPAPHGWPPGTPPTAAAGKRSVAPFVIVGLLAVAIAGASSIATFASHLRPPPAAAPVVREQPASTLVREVPREPVSVQQTEVRKNDTPPSRAPAAPTTRAPVRTRATASAATTAAIPVEPPKLPAFDTQAAVAGLDSAKLKAEASCRGSSKVRLFIQMGFDADGANRGAALSNPTHQATPEAACALRIFRAVRIPAFDMKTRPSGLGRSVAL